MVAWVIGLAGAGKTTIGRAVAAELKLRRPNVVFLDGDDVRTIMGSDLGHTLEDRRQNAWRICRLCAYLEGQGIDVVCAILSLFPETRDWNRQNYARYVEVFVDVPIDVLKQRDQKQLYSRAAAGLVSNVAGIDLPFTPPATPDVTIDNSDIGRGTAHHVERILRVIDAS
jgi:cytidine diphosphoramidate kinase